VLPPPPALRTARLRLTAFRADDAPAVFAYASDPEVARHVTWPTHRSPVESEAFVCAAVAGRPDTHVWAVREGSEAAAVGAVEFSLDAPGRGSVHYVLARRCWERGLATEAVRAVLGWAFDALPDLAEVRTTAAEANAASRRVLEKCGFRPVGTEAARWPKAPAPVPLVVYALTRGALVPA
jgi:RimJ/RimL family protein N-acetyltransferase